jgi:hypothetical protein
VRLGVSRVSFFDSLKIVKTVDSTASRAVMFPNPVDTGRIMPKNAATAGLVAAALIGAVGLSLFARFIWNRARHDEPPRTRYDHEQTTVVYMPPRLIEFAKRHGPSSIKTNDELLRLIERDALQQSWMVIVLHTRDDDTITELPIIVQPGQVAHLFQLTIGALHIAAGRRQDGVEPLVVIPQRLLAKEPLEALPELLEQSTAPPRAR